jgi:Spy/CpxP family protein refolding chaperone
MKRLILIVLVVCFLSSQVSAQSHEDMEFTPGPRMIRAIEQIAGSYVHLGLGLTSRQKETMADLVQRMKKEMWMKEAVLIGMFQELEEKRRHGLLQDNEYRIANTLTGGIETDELNLFIETLASLRAILTADQQAKLRHASHPSMTFRLTQGFNTRIGMMSLEGIGRVYHGYGNDLRLTDAQAESIRKLLEDTRREVLRVGTEIDLSRVEADELVMRPDADPEAIRAKMQKTGETEGVLFSKLFETSDRIEAQLTDEQRKKLAELKRHRQRHAADKQRAEYAGAGHGSHPARRGFEYFLDERGRLGLTDEQIAALVAAKSETRKTVLIEEAKLKGAELGLLNLLRFQDTEQQVSDEKIAAAIRDLEAVRGRVTRARAEGYLKARQILTKEQQERVHPPHTFEDHR